MIRRVRWVFFSLDESKKKIFFFACVCFPETRSFGPITGQIISATKEACRQAFLGSSPRLVLAVYSCNIQATCTFRLLLFI